MSTPNSTQPGNLFLGHDKLLERSFLIKNLLTHVVCQGKWDIAAFPIEASVTPPGGLSVRAEGLPDVDARKQHIADLTSSVPNYSQLLGSLAGIFRAVVRSLRDDDLVIVPTRTTTLYSGKQIINFDVRIWVQSSGVPFVAFTTFTDRHAHHNTYKRLSQRTAFDLEQQVSDEKDPLQVGIHISMAQQQLKMRDESLVASDRKMFTV